MRVELMSTELSTLRLLRLYPHGHATRQQHNTIRPPVPDLGYELLAPATGSHDPAGQILFYVSFQLYADRLLSRDVLHCYKQYTKCYIGVPLLFNFSLPLTPVFLL